MILYLICQKATSFLGKKAEKREKTKKFPARECGEFLKTSILQREMKISLGVVVGDVCDNFAQDIIISREFSVFYPTA